MENKPEIKLQRAVGEPPTSSVLMGPREGFIEELNTNHALIQKRLKTKALKTKSLSIGKYTKTKVSLYYIEGIANEQVVAKIFKKLTQIQIDAIIDSYYLVTFLEEHPNSVLKQVGQTEKPDVLCAKLLEGRVAILCDGSPIALTLPFLLVEDLQSPDDYYQKEMRVTFIRIIRLLGVFLSVLLPGFYLATIMHHYNIIPIHLLVTLLNATANLPFGPLIEMLFILLLFEILYEANLRMPKYLGLALSIVGALILGDTAVKAGFVSPPSVLIIAISSIPIYTTPNQAGQLSLLRFLFTIIGATFSLFGLLVAVLMLTVYLCSISSYGVPYLAPFAPTIPSDLKDAILKKPITQLKTRPKSLQTKNKTRLK
jgi:spore germination protein KA